jgi:hypothetical protein
MGLKWASKPSFVRVLGGSQGFEAQSGWASSGPQMGLKTEFCFSFKWVSGFEAQSGWASSGPQMGLKWIPNGLHDFGLSGRPGLLPGAQKMR